MLTILALAAAAAAGHAGLPYDPPTTPFDNRVARVQLSAGKPGEVTKSHVHLTNRVMIYFEAGTNTIRYPDGKVAPEHFKAGDVQWNDAMGTHTAEIAAAGPVDIVHVELKVPEPRDNRVHAILYGSRDPLTIDRTHFKREMQKYQVRVLRFHLGKGEKTPAYKLMFEHLLVPLTAAKLKTTDDKGAVKETTWRRGDVQWQMPGTQADENIGGKPYEAIIVEFQK